jgi:hypothetical protein
MSGAVIRDYLANCGPPSKLASWASDSHAHPVEIIDFETVKRTDGCPTGWRPEASKGAGQDGMEKCLGSRQGPDGPDWAPEPLDFSSSRAHTKKFLLR